jgi:ABC-2 type transport system permease protein
MLAATALDLAFLFIYSHPDWKPMLLGFLGLLLQAGGLLALGTLISTMTKNQIVAAVATFAVCLMLWVLDWVSSYESSTWAQVLSYLSVTSHIESFAKGVLDLKDAVYYVSLIFLGLFLTTRAMESLRWRA